MVRTSFSSPLALALLAAFALTATACAPRRPEPSGMLSLELAAKEARISELEQQNRQLKARTAQLTRRTDGQPDVAARPSGSDALLSTSARPGECYARVFVPAVYETQTEQVIQREASEKVEIVPAEYAWVQEQVVVEEASTRFVHTQAEYGTDTETVVVEPSRTIWRTGKGSKSKRADGALIAAAAKLGAPIATAQPGQCFVEYTTEPRFEEVTQQVLKREGSSRVEVVAATYAYVEEQVVISEASQKLVHQPAVYETVTEDVLVQPAHTAWKKGRGAVERIDDATGEIWCLVEVPAEYRSVSKRVLKTPATTRTIEIPAKYKTVKVRRLVTPSSERRVDIPAEYGTVTVRRKIADAASTWVADGTRGEGKATSRRLCAARIAAKTQKVTRQVVKTPATTRAVDVPAKYKTVKVKKLVTPARQVRTVIPAEYQDLTTRSLVGDGRLEWRSILCETNTTPRLITDLQRALKDKGYDPGPIDGVVGSKTLSAVRSFQKQEGLPSGNLTLATLDALDVRH